MTARPGLRCAVYAPIYTRVAPPLPTLQPPLHFSAAHDLDRMFLSHCSEIAVDNDSVIHCGIYGAAGSELNFPLCANN